MNQAATAAEVANPADRFTLVIPRIGAPIEGGRFEGIVFNDDGSPAYLLIAGPEAPNEMRWDDAMKWAASLDHGGHTDWTLPDRRDGSVSWANARANYKRDWYWTRETHADGSAYAWGQSFYYGNQLIWHKDDKTRAVAVRRVPIQSFNDSPIREESVRMPATASAAATESSAPAAIPRADLPTIGADFHGGKFAGVSLENGHPVALILLAGDVEKNWKDATAWAKEQGGELPSRFDALVLYDNLPGEFQRDYYWTNVTHADDSAYAWGQSFYDGLQYDWHKDDKYRAVAVRRVPIQ